MAGGSTTPIGALPRPMLVVLTVLLVIVLTVAAVWFVGLLCVFPASGPLTCVGLAILGVCARRIDVSAAALARGPPLR